MPKRILIVDDEPDAISFMSSVLEENGYDHLSADNGVEGLELAKQEKPDMILLDLIMPGKSGIIMFQELKKDHIRFLFFRQFKPFHTVTSA